MAIAMAQAGGIGVLHRNMEPDEQAAQVRQVKKFESGMVVNPLTIAPDATLADARTLMKDHGISGIPVVTGGGGCTSRFTKRRCATPLVRLVNRSVSAYWPGVSRLAAEFSQPVTLSDAPASMRICSMATTM